MDQLFLTHQIKQTLALLQTKIYRQPQPLPPPLVFYPEKLTPQPPEIDPADPGWQELTPGTLWGAKEQLFLLVCRFELPDSLRNRPTAVLHVPLGAAPNDPFPHPEALAYLDGQLLAALDRNHQELPLPDSCRDGEPHELLLYGWHGISADPVQLPQFLAVEVSEPVRALEIALRMGLETAASLSANDPTRHNLFQALAAADSAIRAASSIQTEAAAILAHYDAALPQAGPPLNVHLIATGHAHIDVAWLWTLPQTRQKAARSFSNVLQLMADFPDFHFTQSQPQLYAYIQQDFPDLFAAIQAQVEAGQWELTGGMWVEADCNLTGAESLVRQLLLARSYYDTHFAGADSRIAWLPDTFGFPHTLPQLLKQAGIEYFMTTKLSWNQHNRLPNDSFWWQGLDGTRLLAHFITTPTDYSPEPLRNLSSYNNTLNPRSLLGTWENYQQQAQNRHLLTVFGYGDGGGGPTREMMMMARRAAHHPGLPQLSLGSAHTFFTRLQQEVGDALPTWNGELYLEYHQGVYTSQAAVKQANRRCEALLHEAEFLAAWAAEAAGLEYPYRPLNQAWELLCLNQFHDILPGSSIGEVYVQALADYAEIERLCEQIRSEALNALASEMPPAEWVVLNGTSFERSEVIALPAEAAVADNAGQPVPGGTLLEVGPIPPYAAAPLFPATTPADPDLAVGIDYLENSRLRLEFAANGDLLRIYDKAQRREVLAPGENGNVFQLFDDKPLEFDAWNIDPAGHRPYWSAGAGKVSIIESGPLRVGLEISRPLLASRIVQRITLCKHGRQIDFETFVDWRERDKLLKVAFPVNVLAQTAAYDVQWGNVQRPTHRNTSWDAARYEVPAHHWADLSEGNYGVSLLNNGKYGYDVAGHCLRLTLLKGATYPDPQADLGEHRFTYSLLPHGGPLGEATAAAGYQLNHPLRPVHTEGNGRGHGQSFVWTDTPHVIIETVKQAEDSQGVIVRLYDNGRCRQPVTLHCGFALQAVMQCNILEEALRPLLPEENQVTFDIKPFEIVSLRLIPL